MGTKPREKSRTPPTLPFTSIRRLPFYERMFRWVKSGQPLGAHLREASPNKATDISFRTLPQLRSMIVGGNVLDVCLLWDLVVEIQIRFTAKVLLFFCSPSNVNQATLVCSLFPSGSASERRPVITGERRAPVSGPAKSRGGGVGPPLALRWKRRAAPSAFGAAAAAAGRHAAGRQRGDWGRLGVPKANRLPIKWNLLFPRCWHFV